MSKVLLLLLLPPRMLQTLQTKFDDCSSPLVVGLQQELMVKWGSGCGSVGRAVASDTRGPRFESSHWQKFNYLLNIFLLSTVY